jgi:hypothetical protein
MTETDGCLFQTVSSYPASLIHHHRLARYLLPATESFSPLGRILRFKTAHPEGNIWQLILF